MIASQASQESQIKQIPNKDSASVNSNKNAVYKVFFVDDEQMVLKMLDRHFAKDERLELHAFNSGEACLNALHLNPDVVVLDFHLVNDEGNQLNGLETLEKIKEQCPSAEVVMLSSQMEIKVAVDSLKKGAVDYVIKDQAMQFSVEKAIQSILKSKELKQEINQLSQVIKRDKLLIKGYTVITAILIGLLSYLWIG